MSVMEMPYIQNTDWKRTISDSGNMTDEQSNELIELFGFFKTHQQAERKRVLDHTVKNATAAIEILLTGVKGMGFDVKDIFLKFDNSTSMTALFMVDDDVFCSLAFDAAYKLAQVIEQQSSNDIFDITFNFASKTESLDVNLLACEGFVMRKKSL